MGNQDQQGGNNREIKEEIWGKTWEDNLDQQGGNIRSGMKNGRAMG